MKQVPVVLFIVLLAFIEIKAQGVEPTEFAAKEKRPMFFQDILEFHSGKKDISRLDVFVMVPYTSVQFVKSDKGFSGKYSVTISILDKNKNKLIEEKSWNEKLDVSQFEQTTSKTNSVSLKSFLLAPGEYFLRSTVHDYESNTDYLFEREGRVRSLTGDLAVSDVMLLAKNTEDKGVKKISPNILGDVIAAKDGLPLFYEVYSSGKRNVEINYIIKDQKKKKVFECAEYKNIDSGKTQVFYTIRDTNLNLGTFQLEVLVRDSVNNTVSSAPMRFVSRMTGVPAVITDLDKAIDEMVYIASPNTIDTIKKAPTQEEKLKLFLTFWKKMSPSPESEENPVFDEYYRRVNYANENFSRYFEGWKTDMGMVFILLGKPNNIARHPFDSDSKPYEVWEYYDLNATIVFVDRTGFGDYRLVTQLTGDQYKFRM